MEKKIPVRTLYLLFAISFGLITLGLGSTYAVFTATIDSIINPISFTSNLSYSSDIIETVQVKIPAGKLVTTTLNITNSTANRLNYITWYETSSDEIYTGVSISSGSIVPTGTIASGTTSSVIVQLKNTGSSTAIVTVGISANTDSVVKGSNMIEVSNFEMINLVQYVNDLYNNATKTSYSNNDETYNYAKTQTLLNDRLGNPSSVGIDAGNIRYTITPYGEITEEINNYIDIGDTELNSDGKEVPTLYRMIGLFKDIELSDGNNYDLIKIIRKESIGYYFWDNKTIDIGSSTSSNGSNDWTDARLMMLLNQGYDIYNENNPFLDPLNNIIYGYKGSLYWNNESGECYNSTETCDFTSTGLSKAAREKIENVVWHIGGVNSANYAKNMYTGERGETVYSGHNFKWTGKIGLMYASDYFYAVGGLMLANQLTSTVDNNWLYHGESNNAEATLTPSANASEIWAVIPNGSLTNSGITAKKALIVRPTMYLKSDLIIVSGDGSESKPYVIK